MSFVYLASPYSHNDWLVREVRFHAVETATYTLMKRGLSVFSPIVYTHALAKKNKLPFTAGYWAEFNESMIRAAKELRILMLPQWQESQGVGRERSWAQQYRIPIKYLYCAEAGVSDLEKTLLKLAA